MIVGELTPGVLTKLFERLTAEALVRVPLALTPVALAIEKEAKKNASNGEHRYGTRTPARPGSGPARISGTLVRSITHTAPKVTATGWEVLVGTGIGLYPPYNHRTPSNKYGKYLEKGLRNGTKYPFLAPAFHTVARTSVHTIFRAVFGAKWG